jgi:hypothetical protein
MKVKVGAAFGTAVNKVSATIEGRSICLKQ